jgi:S1-C subfamily serine protease
MAGKTAHQFRLIDYLFIFSLVSVIISCSSTQQLEQSNSVSQADNRYDSEFPSKSVSKELDYISRTVKKLDCLAFYVSYIFPPENTLDEGPITEELIKAQSLANTVTNESVTGTAIVIYYDGEMAGLLTCAHVIDFPDTIMTRYNNGSGPIQVLSIKVRQQNYIKDLAEGEGVEVIAKNKKHDIALLKKKLGDHLVKPSVLNFPIGNTKDLEWGSVVYVMGFPQGQQMVTRAIVSNPGNAVKHRFLTDAIYNRGISGSPVFAIRDGVPNLEWIGVATSSAAQQIYYTKPGKDKPEFINPDQPYTGDVYVDMVRTINYGVTFNTTIEAVVDLIRRNEKELSAHGFDTDQFFK